MTIRGLSCSFHHAGYSPVAGKTSLFVWRMVTGKALGMYEPEVCFGHVVSIYRVVRAVFMLPLRPIQGLPA